jgi:hypothetical protein
MTRQRHIRDDGNIWIANMVGTGFLLELLDTI